ncbi:MAG: hypothetical protein ACTHOI_07490 [Sphingomicrobium sp.]
MKQKLCLALAALALPVPAFGAPDAIATRTTAKGVEPFARCFAAAQDRASRPWWFVPKESGGGTFSNLGARGVRRPYFVEIADRGAQREIRLTSVADASVRRAVDACI